MATDAGGPTPSPSHQHHPQPPDLDARPPVLVLVPMSPLYESVLSPRFRLLKPWDHPHLSREAFLAAHADSIRAVLSTLLAPVDARIVASLPRLGCVATTSAGVDHVDLGECRRRGIVVANVGTVFSEAAAEYAVGLLIDVLRRISAADRYVRRGLWKVEGDCPLGFRLSRKRVGIIGLGSIGSLIAKRLEAFRCTVSYTSRTEKPSVPYQYFSTATELAAHNDVLIASCTLNDKTHHIVDKDVMEVLGKNGIVINIGRGPLVDERELIRCLKDGVIGGAGLDVFEDEPRVPHEFFEMDNVVLSSHVAVITEESIMDMLNITVRNLEAFFSGQAPPCSVPL